MVKEVRGQAFLEACDPWYSIEPEEFFYLEGSREEKKVVKNLLKTTVVQPNTDVEWWGLGGVRLHGGSPRMGEEGWDGRSDLIGGLPNHTLFALPLVVGYQYSSSQVLGLASIQGQWGDEPSPIITGDWPLVQNPNGYGHVYQQGEYGYAYSDITVQILLNSFAGTYPGMYPQEIRDIKAAIDALDQTLGCLLNRLAFGVLQCGFDGLRAAIPLLAEWFTTNINFAADECITLD